MKITYELNISGMTCINCSKSIEGFIVRGKKLTPDNQLLGVVTFCKANHFNDQVNITVDHPVEPNQVQQEQTRKELIKLIESIGFTETKFELSQEAMLEQEQFNIQQETIAQKLEFEHLRKIKKLEILRNKQAKDIRDAWIKGGIGLIVGAGVMLFMALSGIITLPVFLLPIAPYLHYIIGGISTLITLGIGYDTYKDVFKKLFSRIAQNILSFWKTGKWAVELTPNMNTLLTISTLTALGVSIGHFFTSTLPMLFDSALLIFGFRHIGIALEKSIQQRLDKKISFREFATQKIQLKNNNSVTPRFSHIRLLKENDIIFLQAGDTIPADGICLSQTALVSDKFTGSSRALSYSANQPLLAGMKISNDNIYPIEMLVKKTEAESRLAQFDKTFSLPNSDNSNIKTDLQNTVDTAIKYFLPIVMGLGLIAGLSVGFLFGWGLAAQVAIAILVSACPCTLAFITPLSSRFGMIKAQEHGVTFKNSASIQMADNITDIVLDLNGTLTTGTPTGKDFSTSLDKNEAMAIIVALEKEATHSHAIAITEFIHKQSISSTITLDSPPIDCGNGRSATFKNSTYLLGNIDCMKNANIDTSDYQHLEQDPDIEHICYLAKDNKVVGYITLHDPLRIDAKQTIQALTNLGKTVWICSGASKETISKYQLNIPEERIFASCTPHDKVKCLQTIQHTPTHDNQPKKVAMIGDGINDALVIYDGLCAKSDKQSVCDLGIAMQSAGSDLITQQHASVVINKNELKSLVTLFSVASQTVDNIKQNLFASLGYNIGIMALISVITVLVALALIPTGLGAFLPAIGAGLMVVQASLMMVNAYRLKKQAIPEVQLEPNNTSVPGSTPNVQQKLNLTPSSSPQLVVNNPTTHASTGNLWAVQNNRTENKNTASYHSSLKK